jgi:osmotically inducible protein OsmC
MKKIIYTASGQSTGDGRNGHGRSSDGALDVELSTPGGNRPGTNPEQLFAVGYAACFHSALKAVAKSQKAPITDSSVSADVSMGEREEGGYGLAVALHVEMSGVDQETAEALVAAAHQGCPYSNATRGNIEVLLDTVTA